MKGAWTLSGSPTLTITIVAIIPASRVSGPRHYAGVTRIYHSLHRAPHRLHPHLFEEVTIAIFWRIIYTY